MAVLPPLDDRDGVIWLNGKLVPWRDAKVHVCAHSLHYGNAVFEGERAYGGKVFKLTEHTRRLHASGELTARWPSRTRSRSWMRRPSWC